MHKNANETTCVACSCPCEMHKEHNHPVEDKREETKACSACGPEQAGEKRDCGCK